MQIQVIIISPDSLEDSVLKLIHVSSGTEVFVDSTDRLWHISGNEPGRVADILHAFREIVSKSKNI